MRVPVSALAAAVLLAGCGSTSDAVERPDLTALSRAITDVPQNANVLGDKRAKWTFAIYAQPASDGVATKVLPQLDALVKAKVASGELNVKFRAIGPTAASKVIVAAGVQGRFWPALVAFGENRTLDARGLLRRAGVADVDKAITQTADPRVVRSIARNGRIARLAGARGDADLYVVANRRSVQVDITAQVRAGRLLQAVDAAEKKIGS